MTKPRIRTCRAPDGAMMVRLDNRQGSFYEPYPKHYTALRAIREFLAKLTRICTYDTLDKVTPPGGKPAFLREDMKFEKRKGREEN